MAEKSLTEVAQQFAQHSLSLTPVIILGSGASAAHGVPGMYGLAAHLLGLEVPSDWSGDEYILWKDFASALEQGADLESALQSIRTTERQTAFIARATRDFLLPFDHEVMGNLIRNRGALPLTRLFKYLFDSTHNTVNVITPNYDRLAEYAADVGDFSTFTGFNYGYIQSRAKTVKTCITRDGRPTRTVAIWKVHGSLDWFLDAHNQIVGFRSDFRVPDDFVPLMVTPGVDKYRLTHGEPFRTILSCSDKALETARAYFCIGYGFNDEHLQTKLIERCNQESVPLVVITKQLSPAARKFLAHGRCRQYLAIEEADDGARAYTANVPDGFPLSSPLWKLDDFLNDTIGR